MINNIHHLYSLLIYILDLCYLIIWRIVSESSKSYDNFDHVCWSRLSESLKLIPCVEFLIFDLRLSQNRFHINTQYVQYLVR